ncbi:hypothetical protein M9H77_35411 [Catharanthus roseus]|uniref:Uncharacterized protein n=1 Tax=Catharanthus roseus TaxID=4058 RepID=A0ACB9ZRH3_CATRO|nr:hypothetical protein M9H77_35411 [Catharanthus roseus]
MWKWNNEKKNEGYTYWVAHGERKFSGSSTPRSPPIEDSVVNEYGDMEEMLHNEFDALWCDNLFFCSGYGDNQDWNEDKCIKKNDGDFQLLNSSILQQDGQSDVKIQGSGRDNVKQEKNIQTQSACPTEREVELGHPLTRIDAFNKCYTNSSRNPSSSEVGIAV